MHSHNDATHCEVVDLLFSKYLYTLEIVDVLEYLFTLGTKYTLMPILLYFYFESCTFNCTSVILR